jgi:DNA-directed RNA polymerase
MFMCIKRLSELGIVHLCMIHDSYGCHANYVGTMQQIIKEEFVKIHTVNQLEIFKKELEGQLGVILPSVPKRGVLKLLQVLESDYFFA